MTPRRLVLIGLVALLAIGAAFWLAGQRNLERESISYPLYADLASGLDALERVRIYGPGNEVAVTLERADGPWRVLERGGYAADPSRLRSLLRNLADARVIEQKTSQPERYAALGVEDIATPEAKGVRIELDGVAPPVDLIVGSQASGRTGTYVRRSDDVESWLVDRALDVPTDPGEWLDRSVLDVSADRVQSAAIEGAEGRYEAAKSSRADADFSVDGIPAGRELSSPGAANGLATALLRLEADDVRRESDLGADRPDARATFRTFDGLVIDLRGYTIDGTKYVAIDARTDDELAKRFAQPVAEQDAEADGDPAPGDAASEPSVPSAAEAIKERTAGWAYELPAYKYDAIFRPLDELLAPATP